MASSPNGRTVKRLLRWLCTGGDCVPSCCGLAGQPATNRWSKTDRPSKPPRNVSILPVQFANRAYPGLGLEPLWLSDLLKRLPPETLYGASKSELPLAPPRHSRARRPLRRFWARALQGRHTHSRPAWSGTAVRPRPVSGSNRFTFHSRIVLPTTSTLGLHVGSMIDDVAPEGYGQFGRRVFEGLSWGFATIERESKRRTARHCLRGFDSTDCTLYCYRSPVK